MPFREGPINPKTGKRGPLERIPEPKQERGGGAQPEKHSCGLCDDTGLVEEHQFCSCEKGKRMCQ